MSESNTRISRRGFLKATGGTASAVALAGCSGSGGSSGSGRNSGRTTASGGAKNDTASATQNTNGTLRLISETMTSFDPVAASDTASGWVKSQLFDGLLTWPDGEIPVTPLIAKQYRLSSDFMTYTFTLKQGVTFHNGDEVTAQDFVYSFERLAGSSNTVASADILTAVGVKHETNAKGEYVPNSLAVKAVDDYTLRIELQAPFASTLQVLGNGEFAAVPEGIVGDIDGYEGRMPYAKFASKKPIGAGPFVFESWEQGTEVSVTAYEDYHEEGPKIDRVHWQILSNDSTVYNYAMNENADIFTLPTAQYDSSKVEIERVDDKQRKHGTYGPLRNGETANYLAVPTLSVYYIGFNMPAVIKPVRRAVAYALNQQLAVEEVFKGRGRPAYHYMIPRVFPGGASAARKHAQTEYPYGYNEARLDAARRGMEEAGYGPDNPYELTFTLYKSKTWKRIAQTLRAKLASAHIKMKIEQSDFSTLLVRIERLNVEAYSLGWVVPWAAPSAFVKHLNPKTSDPQKGEPESYNAWPTQTNSAQRAIEAWQRIQNHPAPTKNARRIRNEAAITMEEANWHAVANLPVYHEISDRFWYDTVDIEPYGVGGYFRRKYNTVTLGK